jgi:phospholipase C
MENPMLRKQWLKTTCALLTSVGLVQPSTLFAAGAEGLHVGPRSSGFVAGHVVSPSSEPVLSHAYKLDLLRKNIKYVWVLFQENRSFDFYFGTFPGAEGYFSGSGVKAGLVQPIVNTDGTVGKISPFLIPETVTITGTSTKVPLYPADTDSVDHSHSGIDNSLDVVNSVSLNDRYAINEEGFTTQNGQIVTKAGVPLAQAAPPSEAQKQKGELDLAHVDCTEAPILWQWADRFTLFDNFHQTVIGPSTPNAISIIAGQSGVTQWALHPGEGANNTGSSAVQESGGQPVTADPGPFAGSNFDQSPVKPPYGPNDESPATPALNQTYASLPLSFAGKSIKTIIQADQNPALDLLDVQSDIETIASKNPVVPWNWYQEGYGLEPTDGGTTPTYATYVTHHNGPQYFGYVGDNTIEQKNIHALAPFFTDLANKAFKPGVVYVRSGYGNNDGLVPLDPNPTLQANATGGDDHPGYSDLQISSAELADAVNAIAASPYWANSAIIITYDETDGLYDHVPVHVRSTDPFGAALSGGPRIPTIVISPFSSVHAISTVYSEHTSIIKFIDEIFGLTPLEDLPDEKKGRTLGVQQLHQYYLTPVDDESFIGDLFEAFDNARLVGAAAPLPGTYASIPGAHSLPQYGGEGCAVLNIVPTDFVNGTLLDPAPVDFNPRPNTTPGVPTSGTWTP